MNIRGVKKSAATLGLVVVIILVSFALGVAQDRAPAGLGYLFGLHPVFPKERRASAIMLCGSDWLPNRATPLISC